MIRLFALLSLLIFSLSSCFELQEEVYLKKDNSGTYSMTVDLSKHKEDIQATASLTDSTRAERNFISNIEMAMRKGVESFSEVKGVSEVDYLIDYENYLVGFSFDFDNVESLAEALGQLNPEARSMSKPAFEIKKNTFQRNHASYLQPILEQTKARQQSVRESDNEAIQRFQDYVFTTASYAFVIRSEGKIRRYSNNRAEYSSDDQKELVLSHQFAELMSGRADMSNKLKIK